MMAQMAEEERIEYERKKKIEEAERKKKEEEDRCVESIYILITLHQEL